VVDDGRPNGSRAVGAVHGGNHDAAVPRRSTPWGLAAGTGAALLWRAPTQLDLPVVEVLDDGTCLTVLVNPKIRGARRRRVVEAARAGADFDRGVAHLVRVVEYDIPDREGGGTGELSRSPSFLTTRCFASPSPHCGHRPSSYWSNDTRR
jgi:hypothetical protein